MTIDDWKFVAAGFGIQVAPFLAFTLWTFVPMSDRRVVEWFAAFGRLDASAVPLVRARLVRVRMHRRIGALVGAVPAWLLSCWYGVAYTTSTPRAVMWLPLAGYVAGAVVAELRSVRAPGSEQRRASLAPRRAADYVARWVLRAFVVLLAVSVSGTLAFVWVSPSESSVLSALLSAGSVVTAAVASWCCAARVARLPLRQDLGDDPYLDDAFRQMSIVSCLAAASLVAVAAPGAWNVLTARGGSAWSVAAMVLQTAVAVVTWVALRQPVPWTFGSRIRAAWVQAGDGGSTCPEQPAATPAAST